MGRTAIIDTTSKCNLKCAHCYNQERYWDKAEKYHDLSPKEIATMVKMLKQMNFTRLHLLGGEPLLAPNLFEFISCGIEHGLAVSIVTNGTMLDSKMMKKICESGVWSLSVSMDGTTAEINDSIRGKGVFDKVVSNIRECNRVRECLHSDIRFGISFTLTKVNFETSKDLFDFANGLKLNFVNVSYLSNEGEARENFANNSVTEEEKFQFVNEIISSYKFRNDNLYFTIDARKLFEEYIYKKHGIRLDAEEFVGCAGGDEQFYILADGTLLPCSPAGTSMGCQLKTKLKGLTPPNLLVNSVDEIINSPYLIGFYNYTHNEETFREIKPCNECKYNCNPCPLLYKNENKIVRECAYAMKEIEKLDKSFMRSNIMKATNIRSSTTHGRTALLDFMTQNSFIIEDTALFIWNHIDENRKGLDIVELIMREYSLKAEMYHTVYADVLEFLYQLREYKFINIIRDKSEELN